MAKPEESAGSNKRGCVSFLALGLALVGVTGLTVSMLYLDGLRREEMHQLEEQVDALRQLVNNLQNQLISVNNTIQTRSQVHHSVPTEEVEYDEYEYDNGDEEDSEYDDEPVKKSSVKRTIILSQDTQNKTEETRSRKRRAVPIRDESERETDKKSDGHLQGSHHSSQRPEFIEQRRGQESMVRFRHGGIRHMEDRSNIELFTENSAEEYLPKSNGDEKQCNILAAHFVGDTSAYNTRDHPHYKGNSILHHGIFKDWIPANWMQESNRHFPLEDGKVIIKKPGIYLVYAQVYYTGSHDRCGFHIKRNGSEVAQCMTSTIGRHLEKRNTCFTALVLHLRQSDTLSITEVEGNRNTSFKSFHSYFGLIQLKPT